MISKLWKRIALIILIIACLWNIVFKLVNKVSFANVINTAKATIQQLQNKGNNN